MAYNDFNRLQWIEDPLVDTVHQGAHGATMVEAGGIILISVGPLRGVEGTLDDREEHVNERILYTIELMRNKAHQMQIALLISAARHLKDLRLQHQVGIIADAVVGSIERGDQGSQLVIEKAKRLPVLQCRFDPRGPGRLGNLLEQGQLE